MSAIEPKYRKEWRRDDGYLVSTNPSLLSISSLSSAFSEDWMYWAKPLPEAETQQMVDGSLCFGLYRAKGTDIVSPQIGFARIITDYVTFAYLTDVYVLPETRKTGLGSWLIGCVKEYLDSMPQLRRAMLITGNQDGHDFYARVLGMEKVEGKLFAMSSRGPGSAI